jgi:hypothetical protein
MYCTLTTKAWALPVFKIKQSRNIILGLLGLEAGTDMLFPHACTVTNFPGNLRPRLHRNGGLKSLKYRHF